VFYRIETAVVLGIVLLGSAAASQSAGDLANIEAYVTTHSVFGLGRHTKIVVTSDRSELCDGCEAGRQIEKVEARYFFQSDYWAPVGCVRNGEAPTTPRYCWTFAAESHPREIGAILTGDSQLRAQINRDGDLTSPQQSWNASIVPLGNETLPALVGRLTSKELGYIARWKDCELQRFQYALNPNGEDEFNSNSFIATLLREIGLVPDSYEPSGLVPGFGALFAGWYFHFPTGGCHV
jgi:hypothetical protein